MPESGDTGLLVLAKEEDSGGQTDPFTVDIVAIHGVNGHRTKSWSPENGETSQKTWLEDILAVRIPSARIMTFGYDSSATTAGDLLSSSGLRKVAIELLNALCGKRTGKNNLPLIFLCHSLGGLIVKELMCIANDDSFYFSIAARTEHLIFFGMPHQSTDSSSWETLLFDIALACTEGSPCNRRKILTSMIRMGPATLIEVSKRFSSLPWHYRILSFYEEKVSQSVGLVVVEKSSATLEILREEAIGREEDHLRICQFSVGESSCEQHINTICARIEKTAAISATGAYDEYIQCRKQFHLLYPDVCPYHAPQSYPGTLGWLERHETYRLWLECRSSAILHVHGCPGSGKSVLSTYLARKLRRKLPDFEPAAVISHSFDRADNRRNSLRSLLLSFIQQLLGQGQSIYEHIKEIYKSIEQRSNWTAVDLWALFRSIIFYHRTKPIICIVDALEQCESRAEFLSNVVRLQQQTEAPFKFLITSQPEEDICSRLDHFFVINLDAEEHSKASKILATNGRLSALLGTSPNIGTVAAQLSGASFLEIDMTLTSLEQSMSAATPASINIDPVLGLQPQPLSLLDICESQIRDILALPIVVREWVSKALSWLIFAVRPLTVDQLAVAIALDCGAKTIAEIRRLSDPRVRDPVEALRNNLGVLIRIEDGEVHFTHHTVRDFLTHKGNLGGDSTLNFGYSSGWHSRLAEVCLGYLCLEDLKDAASFSEPQVHLPALTPGCYAFLQYAVSYWPQHFREAFGGDLLVDSNLLTNTLKFLEHKHQVRRWFELYNLRETRFRNTEFQPNLPVGAQDSSVQDLDGNKPENEMSTAPESPLLIASQLGLAQALAQVLRTGNYTTSDKVVALETAADAGYADAVEAIMEVGGIEGQSFPALKKACSKGHIAVVKRLLMVNYQPDDLKECLCTAAENGHVDVVSALIGSNTKLDGCEPLVLAAKNGYEEVVLELLGTKEDIWKASSRVTACSDALRDAAENGHLAAVQALLSDDSCDVNARTGYYELSPLHRAATRGHASVVKELLKMHADVDASDWSGRTALHKAALEGHALAVTELLDARANISPIDRYSNNTPLHYAAFGGHLEVLSLLLARGADADTGNHNRCRPLHYAAQEGHNTIVRKLLESGVNEDPVIDDTKTTPLHLACLRGHAQVVRSLLEYGADTTRKVKGAPWDGYSPLHFVVGNIEITRILVEAGAPILAVDEDGNTPMHLAVQKGLKDVSKLLERNTSYSSMTKFNKAGFTALHIALENGFEEIATFLYGGGAEIDAIDENGRSVLFWFGGCGDEKAIKFLLERNANKNNTDHFGRSPLDVTLRPPPRALLLGDSQLVFPNGNSRPKCRLLDETNVRGYCICSICFQSLQGKFYFHCCECHNDGFNVCLNCFNNGQQCEVQDHKLTKRFFGDGHISCEEFSPWVGVLKLPLLAAATTSSEETVGLLLDGGTSISNADENGRTALHLSTEVGSEEVVKILIQRGADIEAVDNDCRTALHAASQAGSTNIVKVLLESGADMLKFDKDGRSALCLALTSRFEGVAELLLDYIVLSKADENGCTPLHRYAFSGAAESLAALLKRGVDTSTVDNSGRSALFLAAGAGFGACVEILLNHGLDKDHQDSFGRVALDVALKPEVRVLLKPDDEIPDQEAVFNCSNFTHIEQTDGKKNYSLANWDCDECSRKILSEFFYHCCKCREDNYDLCATCFASKGGCNGEDDGPLKVRFWGDGMVSFSELSPWVAQSKLPGVDER